MIKELEQKLIQRGITPDVRKAIRNAKICIIDNQIDHLKSFLEGLKKEGFTNIVDKNHVESVNGLLDDGYDLIVLDLKGVAEEISSNDGVGVLESLKRSDPALPILVISGTSTPPDRAHILNQADLIRTKPVLPADLASDVEEILKTRKDPYWSALTILKELERIKPNINTDLAFTDKLKLWWLQHRIIKKIDKHGGNIISKVLKVASIVDKLGSIAIRIVTIAKGLS